MRFAHFLLLVILSCLLAACGGGGGSSSNDFAISGQAVSSSFAVDVSLVDGSGQNVSALKQGATYYAKAKVTKATTTSTPGFPDHTSRSPATNVAVTFATDGGVITPSSGSALTDADGIATVTLAAGDAAGAFNVTADVAASGDVGGGTDSLSYAVASVLAPKITVSITNQHGDAISALAPGAVVTVRALAQRVETNADGTTTGKLIPASGVDLVFASDGGVFDPTDGSATTDDAGRASVRFQANVTAGTFQMSATGQLFGHTDTTGNMSYSIHAPSVHIGAFTIDQPALGAGGSTSLHVLLVGEDGAPYLAPLPVDFTSACASNGKAVVSDTVTTINGVAIGTYTAAGCSGTDTITASVDVPGHSLPITASGTVTIAPPTAGSIVFGKATPTSIALAGRGSADLPETTEVSFLVTSKQGAPVPGAVVHFSLTSVAGGLTLVNGQGQSDGAGEVVATVHSGNIATVFRVVATLGTTSVSTQSGQITVSTGTPDQDSFSMSAETLNPEAWGYDGVDVKIMARAADLFHNPVPDGTLVQFTTEGGSITPSCAMANGVCSVTWTSQQPRPTNGRVTILATTNGDESFVDNNGDGIFDSGDTFTDLPEAFRDDNENGHYDLGEFYLDANGNHAYSQGNGLYDGALCSGSKCGVSRSIDVRGSLVLTMSTSHLVIHITPDPIQITENSSTTVRITVADMNGNLPPAGTTIDVAASMGEVSGADSLVVGNSNAAGPYVAVVTLSGDGDTKPGSTGSLNVTATTPGGTVTMNQARIEYGGGGGGNGQCGFSPAPPNCVNQTLKSLSLNPDTITVGVGYSGQVTTGLLAFDTDGQRMANVQAVVSCHTVTGTMSLMPTQSTVLTNTNNAGTLVDINITNPSAGGGGVCTFTAGSVSTTLHVATN